MAVSKGVRHAVVVVAGAVAMATVPLRPAAATSPSATHSRFQAGYEDLGSAATATASDTFTAPTPTCTTEGAEAIGAGMSTASAFETGAVLLTGCSKTTVEHEAGLDITGSLNSAGLTISPDDVIHVSASESATQSKVVCKDLTTGRTGTGSGGGGTVRPVVGAFRVTSVVPNFGKVRITAAKVDGATPAAASASASDLYSSSHILQIATGVLSSSGEAFTLTFEHS